MKQYPKRWAWLLCSICGRRADHQYAPPPFLHYRCTRCQSGAVRTETEIDAG